MPEMSTPDTLSTDSLQTGARSAPLAQVRDLSVRFVTREATVHAVNGISFSVRPGEVLCILGESGSGKSVTLRALMRLLPPRRTQIEGSIRVCGEDVLAMRNRDLRDLRGGLVSMIFQEPMTALDPVYTVGQQIGETVRQHTSVSRAAARARAFELLELVRIPSAERRLDAYPHELSGGLRQRAMIAMALSCNPRLLLADEPTTALDATVQVQVLILLRRLQRELGMGMIFVTHDLGVAAEIADRVAVMYAGRIVESGPVAQVLGAPAHPYTAGLLASTVHGQARDRDIDAIPGSPPDMRRLLPGCSFASRCSRPMAECRASIPEPRFPEPGHMSACLAVPDPAATAGQNPNYNVARAS
jgi:peptide/nickel transport system ATP-binding protein